MIAESPVDVLSVLLHDESRLVVSVNKRLLGKSQSDPIECGKLCLRSRKQDIASEYTKLVERAVEKLQAEGAKSVESIQWRTKIDVEDPTSGDYATLFVFITK